MLSERQAILAQEVRELGSLILSKASVKQKQGQLESLTQNLADEAAARKALKAENENRLRELGRTFFATAWGFRSALFYEAMRWEIPLLIVPTKGLQMGEAYKEMQQAMLRLQQADKRGKLDKQIRIDQQKVLDDLKEHGSAKIEIDLKSKQFAGYDLVRIKSLAVWLEGVTPHATSGVQLRMISETSLIDRSNGSEFSFTGQPVEIRFKYLLGDKVEFNKEHLYIPPTPFSTWTLRIDNKEDLVLGEMKAVRLEFDCLARAG
jgi:hypothetical protein